MAEKREKFFTPVGEAKWSYVHKPKPPFKDRSGKEKGNPKYQIDVCFDPKTSPEWKDWANGIARRIKDLPIQKDPSGRPMNKNMPIKKEMDAEDHETGRYFVTFKTSDKFAPGVFDRYGREIPPDVAIGNGSKVVVNYCESEYDTFGGGIAFYLNAVQVLDLVEYRSQTAAGYGFKVEDAPDSDDSFEFGANTASGSKPGPSGEVPGIGNSDLF
jgi:hypothetical protein